MAAYAALVSVMQIISQIENHHSPPISLDKQQVESLTQKVNLLQEFLEGYNSPYAYTDEADPLEMRISYAAYAAEDAIESYILYNIKFSAEITDPQLKEINRITFHEQLQKVVRGMDLIVAEVTEMVGVKKAAVEAHGAVSSEQRKSTSGVMVGFGDLMLQLLHSLTGGESSRRTIPIVGMGGIGKTTLASNVFENQLIKEHFDIRVWATISQNCDIRETLAGVLSHVRGNPVDKSETGLGDTIHKILYGRKYLIVLDDMWSVEVWDGINFYFPKYNNGSRIMVTTRLSNLASKLTDHPNSLLNVRSLDEVSSWDLFAQTVSQVDSFPLELENIGKKIVKNCNGHPLAIVVIGGLLANSQKTQQHWEHIEANLTWKVNSENDEYCLRVLRMSYNHLPVRVKPCFLYMGVFEEDRSIRVSTLVKLWVCEGFVRPRKNNKTLETIAEEYFNELVDRNLILVDKLGSLGGIKYCKIHDLLRDLCLREARKQRLYCDVRDEGDDSGGGMISHRRIALRHNDDICRELELNLHVRSILSDKYQPPYPSPDFRRTLRILTTVDDDPWGSLHVLEEVFLHLNLRYLAFKIGDMQSNIIPSAIDLLWNLHTLIVRSPRKLIAPVEVWNMRQLKHIESIGRPMHLPIPPPPTTTTTGTDIVILENLHTLKGALNLYLDEEVVKRIPNIKKLGVSYGGKGIDSERVECLSYLQRLNKLESLICWTEEDRSNEFLQYVAFPQSLKKLKLAFRQRKSWRLDPTSFELEGILQKISFLRLLQKLVLAGGFFGACKWETVEDQFPSLRLLALHRCGQLNEWVVSDSSHFPQLQELHLTEVDMKEIPSEIGCIESLKSIVLRDCCASLAVSAKETVEEQEDLRGEQPDLHVRLICRKEEKDHVQHLASSNFHIDLSYYT